MKRINRYTLNVPYAYIIGSTEDTLVRLFFSTNATLDEVLIWHLEKYPSESISIFTFKDLNDAVVNFTNHFRPQRISEGIYRISFDEARFYMLLEQRHQNGIDLPLCFDFSLILKRIITYFRLNIFKCSNKRKKYLHDNSWVSKGLSNIQVCHEGFID